MATKINTASELIPRGKLALVVFSRWENLELREDGTGWTGYWKIARETKFDKVILYLRENRSGSSFNTVYIADRLSILASEQEGRSIVELVNVRKLGNTDSNWYEFTSRSSNPVRYVRSSA